MGVVRAIGTVAETVLGALDADDRRVLGQMIVWALGIVFLAATLSFSLGIAVRIFEAAAG